MKELCLLCFLVLQALLGYGQTITAKNALYGELGGNGIYYSFNYDRILYQKNAFALSGRIGFSMYPRDQFTHFFPVLPLEVNALFGKSKHHLEVGLGITPHQEYRFRIDQTEGTIERAGREVNWFNTVRLGYRYQKPKGGLLFRAGFTPILFDNNMFVPFAFGGISLGKSF